MPRVMPNYERGRAALLCLALRPMFTWVVAKAKAVLGSLRLAIMAAASNRGICLHGKCLCSWHCHH